MSRNKPGGHAVVGGKVQYLSVSQIKNFELCNRRWFIEKVKGIKAPFTISQEKGVEAHAQVEHYLKTGQDVLGPTARAIKEYLPAPGPDLKIEIEFESVGLTVAGVPLIGYIDLMHKRGEYVTPEGEVKREDFVTAEVIDHKTSSDVNKWAKTADQIGKDTQMVAYGKVADAVYRGLEAVRLSHNYAQTKGRAIGRKVTTLVPLTVINDRWLTVNHTSEEIKRVAEKTDTLSVEPNWKSCGAYGGCPYWSHCIDRPNTSLDEVFGGGTVGIMDDMAKIEVKPVTFNGATIVPGAATIRGPEYNTQQQAVHRVDANGNPIKQLLIEEVPAKVIEANPPRAETSTITAGVLPPDAPKSNPELASECAPCADTGKTGEQHLRANCPTLSVPAPVQAVSAPIPAVGIAQSGVGTELPIVAAPRRRGRPPKASVSETPASAASSATVPVSAIAGAAQVSQANEGARDTKIAPPVAVEGGNPSDNKGAPPLIAKEGTSINLVSPGKDPGPAPVADQPETPRGNTKGSPVEEGGNPSVSINLYINCAPVGKVTQSLDVYAAALASELAKAARVPDIRLGDNNGPLGFGRWRGALAARVRENPPAPGNYVAIGSGEITAAVLEALASVPNVEITKGS